MDIGRCETGGPRWAWRSARRLGRAVVLRAGRPRLPAHLGGRAADDLRHRPRAVHGRGHGRAVPLPAEGDRGPSACTDASPTGRPAWPATASGGKAISASSGRRGRRAGGGLRRAAAAAPADRGAGRRVVARIHDEVENLGQDRRPTCSSTTSTSASRWSMRVAEMLVPATMSIARGPRRRGIRRDHGPRAGYVEQVTEHESARKRMDRCQWRSSTGRADSASTRCSTAADAAPLHLADAGRGDLRGRHRAVHQPHGRAARRAGTGRVDRARSRGRRDATTSSWARSPARRRSTSSPRGSATSVPRRERGAGTRPPRALLSQLTRVKYLATIVASLHDYRGKACSRMAEPGQHADADTREGAPS